LKYSHDCSAMCFPRHGSRQPTTRITVIIFDL
jgi:hypothetical protein